MWNREKILGKINFEIVAVWVFVPLASNELAEVFYTFVQTIALATRKRAIYHLAVEDIVHRRIYEVVQHMVAEVGRRDIAFFGVIENKLFVLSVLIAAVLELLVHFKNPLFAVLVEEIHFIFFFSRFSRGLVGAPKAPNREPFVFFFFFFG